jgi:HEAT repeat protein
MSSPFESYDDLDDADERLSAADPAERRVAIIALGHSGDPAAVGHLRGLVTDPDAGVRQQVAMALGEFDGPESATVLAKLLVDPEPVVASAAADSIGRSSTRPAPTRSFPS